MKKEAILLTSLLMLTILLTSLSSAHEKLIQVQINEDGTSTEQINWKIQTQNFFSYIPKSEWAIEIPKQAIDISVSDKKQLLKFQIKPAEKEKSNLLVFKNSKTIFYFSNYEFNIQYTQEKNPIIYEPSYLYKKTFTGLDDKTKIEIFLPEKAQITKISPETNQPIKYSLEKGKTITVEIQFEIPGTNLNLQKINSKQFQAEIPEQYAQEYQSILDKADQGVKFIEETYGFLSPHKWKIKISSQNPEIFEDQVEGAYLGEGKINLRPITLQKNEQETLNLILHETTHGFNSEFLFETAPNFWWDEGTAIYTTFETLEFLGYDTSRTKKEKTDLATACQNHESLTAQWSPNQLLLNPPEEIEITCQDGTVTDEITYGYAQSYYIIQTLTEKYGQELIKNFYDTVKNEKIEFSSDRETLNNQINYILSKTTGEDTTETLKELGITVGKDKKSITGLPIFEDEETPNYLIAAILIILIAIVIALTLKKKN